MTPRGVWDKIRALRGTARSDWKWAVRFAVLLGVFLACLMPLEARAARYSKSIAQRRHEIELAKQSGLNLLNAAELRQMQERAAAFESGTIQLSQVSAVLGRISEEAQSHHLRVVRIHSDSPVPLKDGAGAELSVKGKKLSRLPIHIRLETNFRGLGEFLKGLSENSTSVMLFDEMKLERGAAEGENDLRCDLTLSYFSV